MNLYRYALRPRSPWRTPWRADTLTGRLCGVAAQVWGERRLITALLDPMRQGQPPFVLSDAFPEGCLPLPVSLKFASWQGIDRKTVKRAQWLSVAAFLQARRGEPLREEDLLAGRIARRERMHNVIERDTGTTGENSLYAVTEQFLLPRSDAEKGRLPCLSLYARAEKPGERMLTALLTELSLTGFGADVSGGAGAFEIVGAPEIVEELDAPLPPPFRDRVQGLLCLSTFQPATGDPTDGCWETLVKYGKMGPEWGLSRVEKIPLVMLRAGACFRSGTRREFLGRALEADEFLPEATVRTLLEKNASPLHPAFGLTVPFCWSEGDERR